MTAQINTQTDGLNMFRVKSSFDSQREKLGLELGNLISATVTAKADGKTFLAAEGFSFEAESSKINGEVGDELYFEVVKTGKKEFSFKQVTPSASSSFDRTFMQMKSVADMKEIFKQNNMLSDEKALKDSRTRNEEAETERKTAQAIAKIRRMISNATGDTSVNAMSELIASGVSLSKISLPVLNDVMKEINVNPRLSKKDIITENMPEPDDSAFTSSKGDVKKSETDVKTEKFLKIQKLNENEILNLLKNNRDITLENIYISKHTPNQPKGNELSGSGQIDLESEILRVLQNIELPKTSANIAASKTLVSNGIDLTAENIQKYNFLKNLDASELKNIIKELRRDKSNLDKSIQNTDLFEFNKEQTQKALYKNYTKIIEALPHISTANIELILRQQKPMTLNNLKDSVSSANAMQGEASDEVKTESAEIATIQRKVAEIRLKLTYEAAFRLAGKNIAIDILPLTDAVNALRKQESENYASCLKAAGAEASTANVNTMVSVYDKLSSFAFVSQSSLRSVVAGLVQGFNITTASASIEAARMTGLYESHSTYAGQAPAFNNLKEKLNAHLENLGLASTEKNLKAAEILFANNMEINEENISRVKLVEAKINRLYNTLHPTIASNMIKDGLNPLNMHVDEMLEYTEKFSEMYGESLGDKIASYIMEMDNSADFTNEERQGIIAIYRMLNTMLNRGGAGLGQIVKNQTPMTLGNMMESAKLYKSTVIMQRNFDYNISDDSEVSVSSASDGSIRSEIEKALANTLARTSAETRERIDSLLQRNYMAETSENLELAAANTGESLAETAYTALTVKNIADYAYPNLVKSIIGKSGNVGDLTAEEFLDFLHEQEADYSEAASKINNERAFANSEILKNLASAAPNVVKWMNDNNIQCTIANILALQGMIEDPFRISKKLDDVSKVAAEQRLDNSGKAEETENTDSQAEALDFVTGEDVFDTDLNGLESIEDIVKSLESLDLKLMQMSAEAQSAKFIGQLSSLRDDIGLQREMLSAGVSESYSLPVRLHDKISGLNMYFLNDNNETENVLLALNTNSLGTVQVYAQSTGDKLSLTVSSDNDEAVGYMRKNADELLRYISKSGFGSDNVELNFAVKQARNILETEILNPQGIPAVINDAAGYEAVI